MRNEYTDEFKLRIINHLHRDRMRNERTLHTCYEAFVCRRAQAWYKEHVKKGGEFNV
jgi:hypothetical protein